MSIRVYEPERKEEITKLIEDNGFPLVWEDGVDAGVVYSTLNNYNFNLFDEEVLKLDEVFEEPILTVLPVYTNEDEVQIDHTPYYNEANCGGPGHPAYKK